MASSVDAPGLGCVGHDLARLRSACPPSTRRIARTSRTARASCTRRTASSRWICRAGSPPASCPSCSARVALDQDKKARLFRFRTLAQAGRSRQAPPEQRAIVEAYARGVNAGLASLRSRPWEYWVLQVEAAPWRPEDMALVSYAMWWDLQYGSIEREKVRRALNVRLGGADLRERMEVRADVLLSARHELGQPESATRARSTPPRRSHSDAGRVERSRASTRPTSTGTAAES